MPGWTLKRTFKPVVFILAAIPAISLGVEALLGKLGANPIGEVTEETGIWTLRFLVLTLAISPLRKLTGWNQLISVRRMVGLFAFFYGFCHFLTYIWLDQFFAFGDILADVAKRPFITAGFTAFVLMIPLAMTSTNKMVQRLGGKRWQRLHRLVYFSAICGVIHYTWLVKADLRGPMTYGVIVGSLLLFRLKSWRLGKSLVD